MAKLNCNKNGFTLIEVLLSLALIFIIVFPLFGFFLKAYDYTMESKNKTIAVNIARNVVNYMEKQNIYVMKAFLEQGSNEFAKLDWRYCFFDDDGNVDGNCVKTVAGNRDTSECSQSTIEVIDLEDLTKSKFNFSKDDMPLFNNGSGSEKNSEGYETGIICLNVLSPIVNGKIYNQENINIYLTYFYKDVNDEIVDILEKKNLSDVDIESQIKNKLSSKDKLYEGQLMKIYVVVNWHEKRDNIVLEGVISDEALR